MYVTLKTNGSIKNFMKKYKNIFSLRLMGILNNPNRTIPTTGVVSECNSGCAPRDIRAYITPLQWCTRRLEKLSFYPVNGKMIVFQDALINF